MSENENAVIVPARLDEKDFLRFGFFDTFRMNRGWKRPLLFTCIMAVFAAACFSFRGSREQASLLGWVLLGIGVALPLVWFSLYLSSVRRVARKFGLSKDKTQYETTLKEAGATVTRGEEHAEFRWNEIHSAWRVRNCIYLYVRRDRAYLLPEDENADVAWEIICRMLPEAKRRDLR